MLLTQALAQYQRFQWLLYWSSNYYCYSDYSKFWLKYSKITKLLQISISLYWNYINTTLCQVVGYFFRFWKLASLQYYLQVQNGSERVIAYASKSLSRAERNYSTTFKELLAVVKFCKHFKHYLYGYHCQNRSCFPYLAQKLPEPWGNVDEMDCHTRKYDHPRNCSLTQIRHVNADALSWLKPRWPCSRSDCPCCKDDPELIKPNTNIVRQIIAKLKP